MKRSRFLARALEQEARQLRGYFLFAGSMRLQRQWMEQTRPDDAYDQTVLLDIHKIAFDGEQGRRLHAMVNLLTRGGYRVWLTPRLCFFQSAKKEYKRRALENVYHCGDVGTPAKFDLCITDRRTECPVSQRTMRLVGDTNRQLRQDELPLPYTMHPDHLDSREDLRLAHYRSQQRRWLLFFGGNRDPKEYHCSEEYGHVKTVPRPRLVTLAESCFVDTTQIPASAIALGEQLESDCDGLVILDAKLHRVEPSRWLDVVSHSQFFLAAPGTTYPVSHNCVEALAVGTIPILEYPELFQPALTHDENCLVYRGEREFQQLMARIKTLPADEIARLRHGAMRYYDEHLTPQSFVQKLGDTSFHRLHMFAYLAVPGAENSPREVCHSIA